MNGKYIFIFRLVVFIKAKVSWKNVSYKYKCISVRNFSVFCRMLIHLTGFFLKVIVKKLNASVD